MIQSNNESYTRVFLQVIPTELFEPTAWELDQDQEFFNTERDKTPSLEFIEPTGWVNPFFPFTLQASDLEALHKQSGLTWKQLAVLFDVDVRYVHYWQSGQKRMSSEHADTLNQLMRLITMLELGPSYRVRNFFEDNFLRNKTFLTSLHKRDFAFLENRARQISTQNQRPDKLPISQEFFRERLPEPPANLMSGMKESGKLPTQGRTRVVQISRKRQKQ